MTRSRRKPRRHQAWTMGYFALIAALALYFGAVQLISAGSTHFGDQVSAGLTYKPDDGANLDDEFAEPVILTAVHPPAMGFIDKIARYQPEGYSTPDTKNLGVSTIFSAWSCPGLVLDPAPILGAQIDLGKGSAVIVQAYGAGQAALSLQAYQNGIAECSRTGQSTRFLWASTLGTPDGGFAYQVTSDSASTRYISTWTQGDVMLSVASPNVEDVRELTAVYKQAVQDTLVETACRDTRPTKVSDAERSPYYSTADYAGWNRKREVGLPKKDPGVALGRLGEQKVTYPGARFGKMPHGLDVGESPVVKSLTSSEPVPEAPIPSGVPASLPKAVSDPGRTAPARPTLPPLTGTIEERVKDPKGPGCGWEWSGQIAPEWDDAEQAKESAKAEKKIQSRLLKDMKRYLSERNEWIAAWSEYVTKVRQWNEYVDEREEVLLKWREVNRVRSEYRRALEDYFAALDAREQFIEDKQNAREEYDALVLACQEQDERDAEENEADSSPSPSPSPTPTSDESDGDEEEPRIECPPKRPSILDEPTPKKPQPPKKPSIPLPASWDDIP